MYKILIKNRELEEAISPAYEKYSIYCIDDKEFETSDLNTALTTMNDLLDKYLRVDLSLINKIETTSEIITPLLKIIAVSANMFEIVNDGKTFSFKIDLTSLNDYTIVNVNNKLFEEVKATLESYGLSDVKLTDTFEIVANNKTGKAIEGTISVEKGLFTLYSRKTDSSNYIISEFSTTLDSKEATIEPEDTEDTKYVDIYFVDEDGNPVIVDSCKMFLRASLGREIEIDENKFDYEFKNVSEVHFKVTNSGNYLIEVEKQNYDYEPYYEKTFTGKSRNEDALTIELVKCVTNQLLDDINGEVIGG